MRGLEMRKSSILIVEDELIIAEDLADGLSERGYEVIAASDLEEAIVQSRQKLPALILMDLNFKLSFEWIKIASTIWEELGIPVVYLTAYSADFLKTLGALRDPIFCVRKPYSEQDLYSVIETVLKKKGETEK